ncbi:MAG: TraR/DksA family transcriptional regulator [Alphaproteobacteria bacterium]|nr:MAG: TraR/DksA family transcriptional regulator [Alphaproteobacteria bacterium]
MTNINQYKERLLALKKELEDADVRGVDARRPVELDQTMVGRLSRMDAMQQQEMALANERRRKMQIHRIDQALARIDSGDYGYCALCDEEIPAKRLDLDPAVPTCVDCAG